MAWARPNAREISPKVCTKSRRPRLTGDSVASCILSVVNFYVVSKVSSAKTPPAVKVTPSLHIVIAGVLLVLATLAAYHNSFSGPFVYDDIPSIKDNPTIKDLDDLKTVFTPPNDSGITVNGRPLINLSLAINWAIGKESVTGYHVVNFLIHSIGGLALFGLVRRTLLLPLLRDRFKSEALSLPLAFAAALIWLVHPLQTESVTYIIQRAESLVGMFYLLTFYCFARSVTASNRTLWEILTVLSCLCGMASKEVMASAPLLVLLYDRAAVSGTFKEAWQRHWKLYAGLAATWLLLAVLVAGTNNRGGTAGFGAGGVSSWHYALTSALAIGKYVKLVFWPSPLVFDYGTSTLKDLTPVLIQSVLIVTAVAATGYALWRRPLLGFIGMWFFAILGPSSSIIPVASETMAEHRMYLPLAAIVVLVVVGLGLRLGRGALPLFLALAVGAGAVTIHRNNDYRDEMPLWRDTVEKYPANARGHNNVGEILFRQEKHAEAIGYFREAVRLLPDYLDGLNNLGNALTQRGNPAEALPYLEYAFKLKPDYPETNNNLGSAYYHLDRKQEALVRYTESVRLKPNYADAHNNLGLVLSESGRFDEAIEHYKKALQLKPNYIDALFNYSVAFNETGRPTEAIPLLEEILRLKPLDPKAHNNLGTILFQQNKLAEAMPHFETAIRQKPDYPDAQANIGVSLLKMGRPETEAIPFFEAALRADQNHKLARRGLGEIYNILGARSVDAGDLNLARTQFEQSIRMDPNRAEAHNNLGVVYLRAGRLAEALPHFEDALRIQPVYPSAQKEADAIRRELGTPKP
jgi:tetratricopeptide (TPR) repeat protein